MDEYVLLRGVVATAIVAGSIFSLPAVEIAVPSETTKVLHVAGEEVAVAPLIQGALRVEGDGSLTLKEFDFPDGAVQVRGTELRLETTDVDYEAAVLPEWVSERAALWFDANINVNTESEGSGVVEWLDVRETEPEAPYVYPRAVQHEDDPIPQLVASDAALKEQSYLDFGGYGSGRWLKWVNPDDSRLELANIRHVFIVFGCQPGFGFLLGDWDWTQEGNVGRKDFHIGAVNTEGGVGAFWSRDNSADLVIFGETRVDGRRVWDPLREHPQNGYQLVSIATAGDTYASNFCNDHNFKEGRPYVDIDRQGGPRFCEVIIFSEVLSMEEQVALSNYLTDKWLTRQQVAGSVSGEAGATVEVEASVERSLVMDSWSGDGLAIKSGAGALQLMYDTELFRGRFKLDEGKVESAAQRADRGFVVSEGGQELSVIGGVTERRGLEDATVLRKTGSGTLTVSGVDESVTSLDIADGRLRLSPQLSQSDAVIRVAIPNASFEEHGTITANSGNWQTSLAPAGWQIITDGNGKAGTTMDVISTPWVGQGTIPDGGSAVFFQYHGGIKTTIQIPHDGIYRLSFQAAARYDSAMYRKHSFGVWIGEQQVVAATSYLPVFERFEYVTPRLSSGEYELRFQGLATSVNRSTIIDDVRLELLDRGVCGYVENSGFEVAEMFGTDITPETFIRAPVNAAWEFDGPENSCGIADVIPWVAGSLFTRVYAEGRRCAFFKEDASISQLVELPEAGSYTLFFQVAARERYEGHKFRVLFDGVEVVPYMETMQTFFQSYEVDLPVVEGQSAELVFEGLDLNTNPMATTLLDDIRIMRKDRIEVANSSFEATSSLADGHYGSYAVLCKDAEWQFELGVDGRRPGISGRHSMFGLPYLGGRAAFIQGYTVVSQRVDVVESGVYELSFYAAPRIAPYNDYSFEVCWRGQRLGIVNVDGSRYRCVSFRLPYASAGESCELMFRGLENNSQGALLDAVQIKRLSVGEVEELLPPEVQVSVAEGAVLELDYDGVLRVAGVVLGGRTRSGVISRETWPEFVAGSGALYAPARGTMVIVK